MCHDEENCELKGNEVRELERERPGDSWKSYKGATVNGFDSHKPADKLSNQKMMDVEKDNKNGFHGKQWQGKGKVHDNGSWKYNEYMRYGKDPMEENEGHQKLGSAKGYRSHSTSFMQDARRRRGGYREKESRSTIIGVPFGISAKFGETMSKDILEVTQKDTKQTLGEASNVVEALAETEKSELTRRSRRKV